MWWHKRGWFRALVYLIQERAEGEDDSIRNLELEDAVSVGQCIAALLTTRTVSYPPCGVSIWW